MIEKRRFATEKICAGFGVPRPILGYIEGVNLSNSDMLYKKFIENTIQPLEDMLETIFTDLLSEFDATLKFEINSQHIDQVGALSDIAIKNVNAGIWTRNEARQYMDWDTIDDDLADELTVQSTVQLLDNIMVGEPTIPVPDNVTKA